MGQKYQIVNGVKCQVDVNGKLLIKGEGVYELPIASETQLGGVAPKNKIAGMEYNDVYVDGVGRLYAPQGDAYVLPVATPATLGGVKPNAKTDAMTASVGVDSEGKLYVQPVQGPAGPQGPEGPRGPEGVQGPAGRDGSDGRDGVDGSDGTSAYATVSKAGNTATITCTDANGTTTAQVSDGIDGRDGVNGTSAFASVSKSGNTATITCTDSNGTTTAQVTDGSDGRDGVDGRDGSNGTSAYASVSKSGNTATITCTDANGTTTAQVTDGATGATGPAGPGVASGGSAGQILAKASGTDYDTEWINAPSGGGGGSIFELGTVIDTASEVLYDPDNSPVFSNPLQSNVSIPAELIQWGTSMGVRFKPDYYGCNALSAGLYHTYNYYFSQLSESTLSTYAPAAMQALYDYMESHFNDSEIRLYLYSRPLVKDTNKWLICPYARLMARWVNEDFEFNFQGVSQDINFRFRQWDSGRPDMTDSDILTLFDSFAVVGYS